MTPRPNPPAPAATLSRQRYERLFFAGMTALLLTTLFVGFAPSYYVAGMLRAPLPNGVIHLHALVFTGWLLLFAAQVGLVSAHRTDLHRRLGILGVGLALGMVITGLLASLDALKRNVAGGLGDLLFMINLSMVVAFAVFSGLAYRMRAVPSAHKRLILMANIALTFAAFIRWPLPLFFHNIPLAAHAAYLFLLPLVLYDVWSLRRVHRVTGWAGAFLIFVFEARFLIADTPTWHSVAGWIRSLII